MHVIVPRRLKKKLDKLAEETGLTVSEHFRRALDQYLAWDFENLSNRREK
jgi:predicted transcriptional regulator